MTTLLAVLLPLALIESVAMLPAGVPGVLASLGPKRSLATAGAFIAGRFVPYFLFGLLVVAGLEAVFDQANEWMQHRWNHPDTLHVGLQLVIGAAMVAVGYRLATGNAKLAEEAAAVPVTPTGAFSVAAGISVLGLPSALPYLAAIDQLLRADLPLPIVLQALVLFNLAALSPLMLIVLASRILGTRSDAFFHAVARFAKRWAGRLLFVGLLVLGAILIVDAIQWFLDVPLLPTYSSRQGQA